MSVKLDITDISDRQLIQKIVMRHNVLDLEQVRVLTCYLDNTFVLTNPLPIETNKFFEIRLYKNPNGKSSIWALPVNLDEGPECKYNKDASILDGMSESIVSLLLEEYIDTHPECGIDLEKF